MAASWLRLWHDMPNDPKWRTIARASKQRIGDVMAVYVHLLVVASNADERGRTDSFNAEDVATAIDIDTDQVEAIVAAMQGRVLDLDRVRAWDKRQPAREDGAAERAKAWREEQKAKKNAEANASERKRTQNERNRTLDTDTDTDTEEAKDEETDKASLLDIDPSDAMPDERAGDEDNCESDEPDDEDDELEDDGGEVVLTGKRKRTGIPCPAQKIADLWDELLPEAAAPSLWTKKRGRTVAARWKEMAEAEGWKTQDEGMTWFRDLLTGCRRSRFLMGKVPPRPPRTTAFKLKFDWFFGTDNFVKVVEGEYLR